MAILQHGPLELQISNLAHALEVAEVSGFRLSFALPNERMRLVDEQGTTLVVGFDGLLRVYGDNSLDVADTLIQSGAAS